MQVKLALLQQELPDIDLAAQHLGYSLERCAGFDAWHEPTPEQLERLESMSVRFARQQHTQPNTPLPQSKNTPCA